MNKWKYFKYIFVLILCFKLSHQIDIDNDSEFNLLSSNHYDFSIEPTKLQIKYVNFYNNIPFTFKNPNKTKDLLVHFYSINCDIDIIDNSTTKAKNKTIQNDTFSFLIKANLVRSTQLIVKPVVNVLDDINSKHNAYRTCPIVINSVYIDEYKLYEDDKEIMALQFGPNLTSLTYEMNNAKPNNFITFSFIFYNTSSSFNVTTPNGKNKTITNSTKLFFDSGYLKNLNETKITITITIIPNSTDEVLLFLKVIESDSVSMLQKNYLNQGFISSNTLHQYYFMEIFNGEEGEIILHDKRQNGELFGVIKSKSIESIDPYNTSEYLLNDSLLEFDKHNQKLSYKSHQTKNCEKGCYLLITYDHQNNESYSIGFEFTLLAKIWDEEDYTNTPIINIPFNEYIFGSFEPESINHHFYSLFIPNDTNQIIIQMEGNYFEGFIGEGKRKLNTFKNSTEKLLMLNNKNLVKIYNKENLQNSNYLNNYISFSFRSKNFFTDIFSFYYFRVIQIKDNESLIYPLDSYVGDICLPELDPDLNKYFCYFSLRNDYNEFSLGYSVSYPNQNEKYNITAFQINKNDSTVEKTTYLFEDNNTNYSFIIFRVDFDNEENQHILSAFTNVEKDINPKIYTNQLLYIKNDNKSVEFTLKHTFTLVLKWVNGIGAVNLDEEDILPVISANFNTKGKPLCFPLSDDIKNISVHTQSKFIFILKLDYIMKSNEIREIFSDESIYEVFIKRNLPIFYYMKYKKGQDIDVNFRIINNDADNNTISDFYIRGYPLNEKNIERMINGDFIDLKHPIEGQYDPSYGFGLLKFKNNQTKINNSTDNNTEYLLIEINSKNNFISSNISIKILGILKNNKYTVLPINQHLQGYIEPNESKTYLLRKTGKITEKLIEFSSNMEDIKIKIKINDTVLGKNLTENYETGVLKYRLLDLDENIIVTVSNNKNNSANYNLRYFSTNKTQELDYKFNKSPLELIKEKNSLSITFDNIEVLENNRAFGNKTSIKFEFYGHLIEKKEDEILNTTALIYSNINYTAKTIATYIKDEKFTLYFNDLNNFCKYYLQINVHITIGNYLFNNDFLSYIMTIDLSTNKKDDSIMLVIIIAAILLVVIIAIIIIFSIVYRKIKMKNQSLEDQVSSFEMLNAGKKKEKIVFV